MSFRRRRNLLRRNPKSQARKPKEILHSAALRSEWQRLIRHSDEEGISWEETPNFKHQIPKRFNTPLRYVLNDRRCFVIPTKEKSLLWILQILSTKFQKILHSAALRSEWQTLFCHSDGGGISFMQSSNSRHQIPKDSALRCAAFWMTEVVLSFRRRRILLSKNIQITSN